MWCKSPNIKELNLQLLLLIGTVGLVVVAQREEVNDGDGDGGGSGGDGGSGGHGDNDDDDRGELFLERWNWR